MSQHDDINHPKHSHYFKDVSHLDKIDIYRVLDLFGVQNPAIQHAIKKLLVSGGRGAKDAAQDVREAMDTLERYFAMESEGSPAPEAPWVPWPGSRFPPVSDKVCVRLRDGTELTRNSRDLRWYHSEPCAATYPYDIVAYRAAP